MKDIFSQHAQQYAKFRPTYPDDLFEYLISLIPEKDAAWDCGTGNGQVAAVLSRHFRKVYATDISNRQIQYAPKKNNIIYKIEPAEENSFDNNHFNLITVAQAIHWFNFEVFYDEVRRTLKPNGIIAAIGYSLIEINPELNKVINKLYKELLHNYWDKERKYIDELYRTIPFPFEELETPEFRSTFYWNFKELEGYLNTWSAVKHYIKSNNTNPVDLIKYNLISAWGDSKTKAVNFPVLIRIGRMGP